MMREQATNILTELYYIKRAHYNTSTNNLNSLTRIHSRTVPYGTYWYHNTLWNQTFTAHSTSKVLSAVNMSVKRLAEY